MLTGMYECLRVTHLRARLYVLLHIHPRTAVFQIFLLLFLEFF